MKCTNCHHPLADTAKFCDQPTASHKPETSDPQAIDVDGLANAIETEVAYRVALGPSRSPANISAAAIARRVVDYITKTGWGR